MASSAPPGPAPTMFTEPRLVIAPAGSRPYGTAQGISSGKHVAVRVVQRRGRQAHNVRFAPVAEHACRGQALMTAFGFVRRPGDTQAQLAAAIIDAGGRDDFDRLRQQAL